MIYIHNISSCPIFIHSKKIIKDDIYLQTLTYMHEYKYYFFVAATRIQINKKSKDESFIARNWWKHYLWRINFLIRKLWCGCSIAYVKLNRRILEMYSRAKEIKSIARYRFEWFLPSHTYRVYWTYFISWMLNVRDMESPGLRRTLFITAVQSMKKREKRDSGRKDEKLRKRKGDRGKEKNGSTAKRSRSSRSTKARFDGVVVPRLLNLLRLVSWSINHPTATLPPTRFVLKVSSPSTTTWCVECARAHPFIPFWDDVFDVFKTNQYKARLSHWKRSDVYLQFAICKWIWNALDLKCD